MKGTRAIDAATACSGRDPAKLRRTHRRTSPCPPVVCAARPLLARGPPHSLSSNELVFSTWPVPPARRSARPPARPAYHDWRLRWVVAKDEPSTCTHSRAGEGEGGGGGVSARSQTTTQPAASSTGGRGSTGGGGCVRDAGWCYAEESAARGAPPPDGWVAGPARRCRSAEGCRSGPRAATAPTCNLQKSSTAPVRGPLPGARARIAGAPAARARLQRHSPTLPSPP